MADCFVLRSDARSIHFKYIFWSALPRNAYIPGIHELEEPDMLYLSIHVLDPSNSSHVLADDRRGLPSIKVRTNARGAGLFIIIIIILFVHHQMQDTAVRVRSFLGN